MDDIKPSRIRALIGPVYVAVSCIVSIVFFCLLAKINVLPMKFYLPLLVIAGLICTLIGWLVWKGKSAIRIGIGSLIALLYVAALIWGSTFISDTMKTLNSISVSSEDSVHVSSMSVYVRKDDPAQDLISCADYTIGIMEVQDRSITNTALSELERDLNSTLSYCEYSGPVTLVEALINKDVDCILFSSLFFDLVSANSDLDVSLLRELTTLEVVTEEPTTEEESEPPVRVYDGDDVITIYISGLDYTGDITQRPDNGNGDVNIIATINVKTHEIALVSTPRDFYLELSNWGVQDKLTHAAFYGLDCSMSTLENLYDIDIDYYFQVNYNGFCQIIDAVGGVELINDVEFTSDALSEDYYFPEGKIHLDGLDALAYVRCRHAFWEGDVARGRHQMMVIEALIKRCMDWDVLTRYAEVFEVFQTCFVTDVPLEVMTTLIQDQFNFNEDWHVTYYTSYGWGETQYCYSYGGDLSVMIPMRETVNNAKELMRQVRDGEVGQKPVDPAY